MSTAAFESEASSRRNHVVIVANAFSGRKDNRSQVEALCHALAAHNYRTDVLRSQTECGRISDASFMNHCRCIVIAGGDGTVAGVVNQRPTAPVIHLPIGNENLFAREFGYKNDIQSVVQCITNGQVETMDIGCVQPTNLRFTLMLSAGYDAAVVHGLQHWRATNPEQLKRVDRREYYLFMATTFLSYDFNPVTLEADGESYTGSSAFIFNMAQYGMGFDLATHAVCNDGLFDWIVFERPGRLALASYMLAIKRGRHLQRSDVKHGRARHLRLTAPSPVPLQADGDPAGHTPVEVAIEPASLKRLRL